MPRWSKLFWSHAKTSFLSTVNADPQSHHHSQKSSFVYNYNYNSQNDYNYGKQDRYQGDHHSLPSIIICPPIRMPTSCVPVQLSFEQDSRPPVSNCHCIEKRAFVQFCQYMYRTLVRTWPLTTSPEAQKKGTVRLLVYHCRAQHRTFTQRTTWSENFLHRRSLCCVVLHRRSLWVTVQVIV